MRNLRYVLILFLTLPLSASAQVKFTPVLTGPVEFFQITDSSVFVNGFWVPLDKKSELSGPSTSQISCDRREGICNELQVNVWIYGNLVQFEPDSAEYKVIRWN